MMSEEKMQENLNVFLRSSFFVPLLKRMTGQKDELSNEGAGKYQEISREMQRKEEKKQGQDPKAPPQEEQPPQVSYRGERQVVEQVREQSGLRRFRTSWNGFPGATRQGWRSGWMTNLRFKEYVFRYNPARLKVSRCQKVSRSCCYGVGEHLQLLGNGLTVVEGEGELFGADALEQFYALQKLAGQGVGLLSGAGLEPMQAVLEEVEMVGVGGQELVEYRVRFVEERKAKGWS